MSSSSDSIMSSSSCSSNSISYITSSSSSSMSSVSLTAKIALITSSVDEPWLSSESSKSMSMSSLIFIFFVFDFSFDSPSLTRYSWSALLSVKWISSPSFLTMIPSSSPIALNTLRISSSEASVKSIGLSSESMSMSKSKSMSISSALSASISTSTSSVSSSMSTSTSTSSSSSCSDRDSFTNWLISSFIVEASIPFAFSAIASSTFFIWISASCTKFLFSCIEKCNLFNL